MRVWGMLWVVVVSAAVLPHAAIADEQPARLLASLPSHLRTQTASIPPTAPSLVDQLARRYTSPDAVAGFLRDAFTFTRDEDLFGEVDYWQSPEEFAARRVGDCEDYALLAQALLRRNGVEAYVVSLFGEDGYAHTVSVFIDEQGRHNVINQGAIRYYRAASLEALASAVYPGWTFGGIAEREGTRGRFVRELINPAPAPDAAWGDFNHTL